jgi:hypothetical protein
MSTILLIFGIVAEFAVTDPAAKKAGLIPAFWGFREADLLELGA